MPNDPNNAINWRAVGAIVGGVSVVITLLSGVIAWGMGEAFSHDRELIQKNESAIQTNTASITSGDEKLTTHMLDSQRQHNVSSTDRAALRAIIQIEQERDREFLKRFDALDGKVDQMADDLSYLRARADAEYPPSP